MNASEEIVRAIEYNSMAGWKNLNGKCFLQTSFFQLSPVISHCYMQLPTQSFQTPNLFETWARKRRLKRDHY